MSQAHLHSLPDAVQAFGALDRLQPGKTMRFARDHDPLPPRAQIAQRCGERADVACRQREPDAIGVDLRVVRRFV